MTMSEDNETLTGGKMTLALILVLPIISGNATNNETEDLFQPVKMKTAVVLDDQVDCSTHTFFID